MCRKSLLGCGGALRRRGPWELGSARQGGSTCGVWVGGGSAWGLGCSGASRGCCERCWGHPPLSRRGAGARRRAAAAGSARQLKRCPLGLRSVSSPVVRLQFCGAVLALQLPVSPGCAFGMCPCSMCQAAAGCQYRTSSVRSYFPLSDKACVLCFFPARGTAVCHCRPTPDYVCLPPRF